MRQETQCPFPVATGISGFLSILKRNQASSPFEALSFACLSRCQRDVRTPVEIRRGPRAFSRVSTGDSDVTSSWKMKDESALKPLQGHPAFFQFRASRCPFHLWQQTQCPSLKPITEKSLLWCLWKDGIPLDLKPGNQLSSREDLWYTEPYSCCCAELGVFLDLGWCSRGILSGLKKSSHLSSLMVNAGWIWSQWRGIRPHLELIWGTHSYFAMLW